MPWLFKPNAIAIDWKRRQNDREVTRPLGDLATPQLAFLLQTGQWLIDHRQQLEDDRRRDVRHDAQERRL